MARVQTISFTTMTMTIREFGKPERLFRLRRISAERWEAALPGEEWGALETTGSNVESVERAYQLFLAS